MKLPVSQMSREQFYRTPWVQKALVDQFKHRYITMRYGWGMARHYTDREMAEIRSRDVKLWGRPDVDGKNHFIEIHKAGVDDFDPTDLNYFIRRGVIEFIPEVSLAFDLDRTDTLIIDLDPKSKDFTWDDLKKATKRTMACLLGDLLHGDEVVWLDPLTQAANEAFKVQNYKLRFSGNRSFHIYIKLDRLIEFPVARAAVKKILDEEEDENYTYHNVRGRDNFILVDIGAIARHRCVRSLWSTHAKTGLVCVPVPGNDIDNFNFENALPEKVVSTGSVMEVF